MRTGRPVRKTFPVNMMLEGRPALVVGGGRVGQRKVELLLDAGAAVRLVCPACVAELEALAAAGRIERLSRPFEAGDLAGAAVAFACTDDKRVNRAVLDAARAEKVPCCCADGNWADGDFVTPAVVRSGDLLLAVSTNGKSCRRARLVKEQLKRDLDALDDADLLVLGTSHDRLPAAARAPYHLPLPGRVEAGGMIRQVRGVHEFLILNTCNRVELVAAASRGDETAGILRRILRFDRLPPDGFYVKRGFDAFAHLCLVAAGMESQTPGEFHVVAQIKDAVCEAETFGWAGPAVHELADAALHVSKEIRHAAAPLLEVSEIEDVALRYLDEAGKGGPGRTALVLGTGVVGRGLAEGLARRGAACVWAYHRNVPEPLPGGRAPRPRIIPLAALEEALPAADAVISAAAAPAPLLTRAAHAGLLNKNGALLIDLGMPRTIDPGLAACGAEVIGLDELKNWHRERTGSLDRARALCAETLEAHRGFYERIRDSLRMAPPKNGPSSAPPSSSPANRGSE